MSSASSRPAPAAPAPARKAPTAFERPAVLAVFTALLLLVGGWVVSTAWTELRAEFPYLAAQDRAKRWTEGTSPAPTEAAWQKVLAELHSSEKVRPDSPALQELLGSMYLFGAQEGWQSDEQNLARADRSLVHYRQALKLRPTDGMTWALLAMALADTSSPAPALAEAINQALTLAPNDNHTQLVLLHLAVRHWERVPPELQAWATQLFEDGNVAQRKHINALAGHYGWEFTSETAPR
ncbi:MAG: hypothetical protein LW854_14035 [Rubrivivax sp.]|jgi:tetratricopeptide (TPR) repeat protein|nr:hypothetical protein [Rubrivivax sp.]